MIPTFCCPKTDPSPTVRHGHRLQFDLTLGELRQLYAAALAYYGDPAAPPLNRDDSVATADLNRATCTLYVALRNTSKSAL